jgi:hypothetical protein
MMYLLYQLKLHEPPFTKHDIYPVHQYLIQIYHSGFENDNRTFMPAFSKPYKK